MLTEAMYCFHAEYEDITLHLEDKTLTFSPYKTMKLDVPSSSTFAGYYSGDVQYFDKSGNLLKPIDYSDLMKLEARYNCTLSLNNSDSSKETLMDKVIMLVVLK